MVKRKLSVNDEGPDAAVLVRKSLTGADLDGTTDASAKVLRRLALGCWRSQRDSQVFVESVEYVLNRYCTKETGTTNGTESTGRFRHYNGVDNGMDTRTNGEANKFHFDEPTLQLALEDLLQLVLSRDSEPSPVLFDYLIALLDTQLLGTHVILRALHNVGQSGLFDTDSTDEEGAISASLKPFMQIFQAQIASYRMPALRFTSLKKEDDGEVLNDDISCVLSVGRAVVETLVLLLSWAVSAMKAGDEKANGDTAALMLDLMATDNQTGLHLQYVRQLLMHLSINDQLCALLRIVVSKDPKLDTELNNVFSEAAKWQRKREDKDMLSGIGDKTMEFGTLAYRILGRRFDDRSQLSLPIAVPTSAADHTASHGIKHQHHHHHAHHDDTILSHDATPAIAALILLDFHGPLSVRGGPGQISRQLHSIGRLAGMGSETLVYAMYHTILGAAQVVYSGATAPDGMIPAPVRRNAAAAYERLMHYAQSRLIFIIQEWYNGFDDSEVGKAARIHLKEAIDRALRTLSRLVHCRTLPARLGGPDGEEKVDTAIEYVQKAMNRQFVGATKGAGEDEDTMAVDDSGEQGLHTALVALVVTAQKGDDITSAKDKVLSFLGDDRVSALGAMRSVVKDHRSAGVDAIVRSLATLSRLGDTSGDFASITAVVGVDERLKVAYLESLLDATVLEGVLWAGRLSSLLSSMKHLGRFCLNSGTGDSAVEILDIVFAVHRSALSVAGDHGPHPHVDVSALSGTIGASLKNQGCATTGLELLKELGVEVADEPESERTELVNYLVGDTDSIGTLDQPKAYATLLTDLHRVNKTAVALGNAIQAKDGMAAVESLEFDTAPLPAIYRRLLELLTRLPYLGLVLMEQMVNDSDSATGQSSHGWSQISRRWLVDLEPAAPNAADSHADDMGATIRQASVSFPLGLGLVLCTLSMPMPEDLPVKNVVGAHFVCESVWHSITLELYRGDAVFKVTLPDVLLAAANPAYHGGSTAQSFEAQRQQQQVYARELDSVLQSCWFPSGFAALDLLCHPERPEPGHSPGALAGWFDRIRRREECCWEHWEAVQSLWEALPSADVARCLTRTIIDKEGAEGGPGQQAAQVQQQSGGMPLSTGVLLFAPDYAPVNHARELDTLTLAGTMIASLGLDAVKAVVEEYEGALMQSGANLSKNALADAFAGLVLHTVYIYMTGEGWMPHKHMHDASEDGNTIHNADDTSEDNDDGMEEAPGFSALAEMFSSFLERTAPLIVNPPTPATISLLCFYRRASNVPGFLRRFRLPQSLLSTFVDEYNAVDILFLNWDLRDSQLLRAVRHLS
eukprot:Clim_evm42s134 gene=Clim_evmTU42s134